MSLVRVRDIEVYPYGGWLEQPWDDDPMWDAFARSSRRVSERFSELARGLGGRLPRSVLRLDHGGHSPDGAIHLQLVDPSLERKCVVQVSLPVTASGLDGGERAWLALAVHHAAGVAVAEQWGADPEPFHEARAQMETEGLSPLWCGPWKSSPSRRLRARLCQVIEDDGWARAWIEVSTREGEVLGYSRRILSPGSLVAWRRATRALHWVDDTAVSATATDALGDPTVLLYVRIDRLHPAVEVPTASAPSCGVPDILIDAYPDEVAVTWGDINGYPHLVPREIRSVWSSYGSRVGPLASWWTASPYRRLDITLDVSPDARNSTNSMDGWLFVTVGCTPDALEGVDAEQLFAKVTTKAVELAAKRARIAAPDLADLLAHGLPQ